MTRFRSVVSRIFNGVKSVGIFCFGFVGVPGDMRWFGVKNGMPGAGLLYVDIVAIQSQLDPRMLFCQREKTDTFLISTKSS